MPRPSIALLGLAVLMIAPLGCGKRTFILYIENQAYQPMPTELTYVPARQDRYGPQPIFSGTIPGGSRSSVAMELEKDTLPGTLQVQMGPYTAATAVTKDTEEEIPIKLDVDEDDGVYTTELKAGDRAHGIRVRAPFVDIRIDD